ncbi:MAG: hypothetical protein R2684_03745 [Pyrinomonadaceae bacterium]
MESIFGNEENGTEVPTEELKDLQIEETEEIPPKEKGPSFGERFRQWTKTEGFMQAVYLAFGLFLSTALMVMLQFSTRAICCGDFDGYYHIRWSSMIWENFKQFKWLPEFKWLPLTLLDPSGYADHHFLFHVLQIPFLWFFEPVMAAKVATVVFGSLAIFSVYWILYKYKIDYLLIWLFAILACGNPFLYRMNMAKAPPLTIIYTIIGIYLLFERKYVWLLPLMFVFVWTYSLFPLLFVAAVIWVAIIGWNEKKFEWQPLAYTAAGMVLGNLVNPYFPSNIGLFTSHFMMKFRDSYEVVVGGEWYAYSSWQLVTHIGVALLAMFVGYVLFRPQGREMPEKATFFLVFSTLLLVWMFKSKRLAEYFPPFAILFCAFSWKAFVTPLIPQLPDDFRRDISPLLDVEAEPERNRLIDAFRDAAPWTIGIALAGILLFSVAGSRISKTIKPEDLFASIQKTQHDDTYGEAMEWAVKNIPQGEMILNCNWDDFPKLFYFDTRHTYAWGLDPNYLYSKNPELFKQLKDVTTGKTENPGQIIRDKFKTRWLFTDAKECEDLVAKLLSSGWAETVHEDGEAYILKIRDGKGDPQDESVDEPEDTQEEDTTDDPNAVDDPNADPNDEETDLEESDPDAVDEEDPDQIDDTEEDPPEEKPTPANANPGNAKSG